MYGNLYEVPTANELIVGNHDSLILFGNDAQQTLIDVSKKLSSVVLKDNGEIEYLIQDIVFQIDGGLRSGMGYVGAGDIPTLIEKAQFVQITNAGLIESHPHDIQITRSAPNYK